MKEFSKKRRYLKKMVPYFSNMFSPLPRGTLPYNDDILTEENEGLLKIVKVLFMPRATIFIYSFLSMYLNPIS
jgi:hypothetical protein